MPNHKARTALNTDPLSLTFGTEELPTDIDIYFTMREFYVKRVLRFCKPGGPLTKRGLRVYEGYSRPV
jgi:hypothetical protein